MHQTTKQPNSAPRSGIMSGLPSHIKHLKNCSPPSEPTAAPATSGDNRRFTNKNPIAAPAMAPHKPN